MEEVAPATLVTMEKVALPDLEIQEIRWWVILATLVPAVAEAVVVAAEAVVMGTPWPVAVGQEVPVALGKQDKMQGWVLAAVIVARVDLRVVQVVVGVVMEILGGMVWMETQDTLVEHQTLEIL